MKLPDAAASFIAKFRRREALGWLIALAVAALAALPLFRRDWYLTTDVDTFSAWYEAVRRTILEYGEFPFWNPWTHGGTPLFANPQVAVFGLETPLSLLFGAWMGWRIAAFCYLLLGAAGMYLLTGDWTKDPAARAWGAVLFAAGGAWPLHLAMGHPVFCGLLLLPYLIWFVRRADRDWRYAAGAGAVLGLIFDHALHYGALIALLTAAAAAIPVLWRNRRNVRFFGTILWGLSGLCAAGGYRLTVTLDYLSHFPRATDLRMTVSPLALLKALAVPFVPIGTKAFRSVPVGMEVLRPDDSGFWHWHELGCYVGVLALGFFLWSLRRGVRGWHLGAAAAVLLLLDSASPWMPGYWLRRCWPFTSFLMITRWRFLLLFCVALGAAAGLDAAKLKRSWKWAAVALSSLMLIANGWVIYGGEAMPRATAAQAARATEAQVAQVAEVFANLPPQPEILTVNFGGASSYILTARNYAEITAYEPQLGYDYDARWARRPADHPEYRGECYTLAGEAVWRRRTPNRIAFAVTSPEAVIGINQNPGSYWRDGAGNRVFPPSFREFEDELPFELAAEEGDHELVLRPRLHEAGLAVSLAGWLGLAAAIALDRRKREKTNNGR